MSSAKKNKTPVRKSDSFLSICPTPALIISRLKGKIIQVNPAARTLFGLPQSKLIGRALTEIFSFDNPLSFPCDPQTKIEANFAPTGTNRFFLITARDLPSSSKNLKETALFFQEKECPKNETETDQKITKYLQRITDIYLRYQMDYGYTFVSPSVKDILGYEPEDFNQDVFFHRKTTHPSDLPLIDQVLEAMQAGDELVNNLEVRQIHRDGHIVYLEAITLPLYKDNNQFYACEIFARDITSRKMTEKRLRRREDFFTTIYQNAPVMINVIDQRGHLVLWNRECKRLTGWAREELAGQPAPLRALFIDKTSYQDFIRRLWEAEGTYSHYRIIARDQSHHTHEWASFPLPTGEIVSVGVDTTEKEKIHEQLRVGQARLRQIINLVPHFIYAKDVAGRYILANQAIADFYGVTVEEMLGKTDKDFGFGEQAALWQTNNLKMLHSGQQKNWIEEEVINPEGKKLILRTFRIPFSFSPDNNEAILGVSLDITESKKWEQEMIKSGKLESIGVLAGGIAHDFNNILAGILGHITLAEMMEKDNLKIIQKLSKAKAGIDRARHLTKQLLTFSRGGKPIREPLRIDSLLKEAIEFAMSGSHATFSLEIDDDLKSVLGEAGQLNQVFYNLAINADQAMPNGGAFKVKAENISLDENTIKGLAPGEYVHILAQDEGDGIPEDIITDIFDPFFSTKDGGSGLGLAVAYSIIHNHHGVLLAESPPSGGALFHIYIPASDTEALEIKEEELDAVSGSGKILIIDDEQDIREAVGEMLDHLGYTPTMAASGKTGLSVYRKAKQKQPGFKAVILDLTMPGGWSGKRTAAEILKIDPGACLISTSGYSNDSVLAQHQKYGFADAISKPYSLIQLGSVLNRAIRKHHPPTDKKS